jgi:hypothetical protein
LVGAPDQGMRSNGNGTRSRSVGHPLGVNPTLCSSISEDEPSMVHYVRWLAAEVSCLPEVFAGVNKIFVFATIEGMFVIAGDSVDLATL